MPRPSIVRLLGSSCLALIIALGCAGVASAHGGRPPLPSPPPTPPPPPPTHIPDGTVKPGERSPVPTPSPAPTPTPSPSPTPSPTPLPFPAGSTSGATPAAVGSPGAGAATVSRRGRRGHVHSFGDWAQWWGFNRAHMLEVRSRLHADRTVSESAAYFFGRRSRPAARTAARPSNAYVRKLILPALLENLGAAHPDVRDSACIAVGKIGGPAEIAALVPLVRDKVVSVREAAVIGLGLLRTKKSIPTLLAVLNSSDRGRMIRGGMPEGRLRGCAAIAIGLAGSGEDRAVRLSLMRASHDRTSRDLRVCATVSLGLLDYKSGARRDVAAHLERLCRGSRDDRVRAHAATALGRIHRGHARRAERETVEFLCRLARRDRSVHVRRSAIVALGAIDTVSAHPGALKVLRQKFARDKDALVRRFAAITLGRVGGDPEGKLLIRTVLGQRDQHAAFAALGLGLWAQRSPAGREPARSALRRAFTRMKNQDLKAGVAIALGIARDAEAGPLLLEALRKRRAASFRGHLAVALGMTGYTPATESLRHLLAASDHAPALKREVAIGLGLLGDCEMVPPMIHALRTARSTYVKASIAQALGAIGDRRAMKPLVAVVRAPRTQSVTRAFACIALGAIGEDEPRPPLAAVFADHNYLASTALLMSLWDIL